MFVRVINNLISKHIAIYQSSLLNICVRNMAPCVTVLPNNFVLKNHTRFNLVEGKSPLTMISSTQKLTLMGKNDFE